MDWQGNWQGHAHPLSRDLLRGNSPLRLFAKSRSMAAKLAGSAIRSAASVWWSRMSTTHSLTDLANIGTHMVPFDPEICELQVLQGSSYFGM